MLWIGTCSPILAKQVYFKTYQMEDGLAHNSVWCTLQDSYGFIWFGTSDGLNRFDGRNFKTFKNDLKDRLSIGNNSIYALCEDSNRNLWIGTGGGVFLFNPFNETFHPFENKTAFDVSISSEIRKIFQSSNGRIWIATLGQGFFIYDPAEQTLTQNSRCTSFTCDINEDNAGRVYISSLQEGLFCFDLNGRLIEQYSSFNHIKHDSNGKISCLQPIGSKIWFGMGSNYLCCLNVKTGKIDLYTNTAFNTGIIRCISTFSEQELLIGTDKGCYFFDLFSLQFIQPDIRGDSRFVRGLPVCAILKDREGGYWVSTEMGGVNYLAQQSRNFSYFCPGSTAAGEIRKTVNTFCEDQNQRIWIGAQDGLYFFEPNTQIVHKFEGLHDDVRTLLADGHKLWVGTFNSGLKVIDLQTERIKHYYYYNRDVANTICSNNIVSLYKSSEGKLHIGTNWGLCIYNRENDNFTTVNNIGLMTSVADMLEDSHNNLWIATYNSGVFRYELKNKHWTHYRCDPKDPNSINSNSVIFLFEDHNENVWFGTNGGGLCSYQPNSDHFIDFDQQNTILPNKIIYTMEEDNRGHLWIATNKGLVSVDPVQKAYQKLYTYEHGLQGDQFSARASLKTSNGWFYFGGSNGFNVFYPDELSKNSYIPPTYIVDVESYSKQTKGNRKKYFRGRGLGLKPKTFTFPHDQNNFIFSFASLSYEDPLRNQLAYRLVGFDHDWIHTKDNHASYASLSPGRYIFLVKGSNNDGMWNDKTATLEIIVTPPWWQTVWAFILYCVILFVAGYGITKYVNYRMRTSLQAKVDRFQVEKEQELYRSKINFFINLVHEFRTPLTLIRLPLDKLKESFLANEHATKYLSVVDRNVDYLLGVVNQLIDFQKIENSEIEVLRAPQSAFSLLQDIYHQFTGYLELKNITFELRVPEDDKIILIDREIITKIVVNLLGNAIKYAHSKIALQLQYNGQYITISVIDDGIGVDDNEKEKIFNVFYQTKEAAKIGGAGIGLAFAKLLAQRHQAELSVQNNNWGGATFVLTVAIKNETVAPTLHHNVKITDMTDTQRQTESDFPFRLSQILLVEDNLELLNIESEMLSKYFTILTASNGYNALDILQNKPVNLIVSDVMMPEMDGFELCRKVKSDINFSHIPVILLTAKTTMDEKIEGLEHGADVYIEKPFAIKYLKKQIENLLKLRLAFQQQILNPSNNLESLSVISQADDKFISKLHAEIDKRIMENTFSIEDLANSLFMSQSSLYRKVKMVFGVSPNDYLKIYRLNKAASMLREDHALTIETIAIDVGLVHSSQLAKGFKQYFGMSPKEYRNHFNK